MHIEYLIPIVSYFLGSIPFGYLLIKYKEGQDIRSIGKRKHRRHQRISQKPGGRHTHIPAGCRERVSGGGSCRVAGREHRVAGGGRGIRDSGPRIHGLAPVQGGQGRRHLVRQPSWRFLRWRCSRRWDSFC